MNKEYVKQEMEMYKNLLRMEKTRKKLVKHAKLEEAMKTGERFQQITEEDKKIILQSLDKMYEYFGKISSNALSCQAELVYITKDFQNSLREVDDES